MKVDVRLDSICLFEEFVSGAGLRILLGDMESSAVP